MLSFYAQTKGTLNRKSIASLLLGPMTLRVFATLNSGLSFHVLEHVSEEELDSFLRQTDYPTVWCTEFMRSMASAQHYPVLFRVEKSGTLIVLALGMFRPRFLRSHLILPSYPRFLSDCPGSKAVFWQGLDNFCRKHGVVRVAVNSYEAPEPHVPELHGLTQRKERSEFYIDLSRDAGELLKSFSSSHRRNIKKAQKHDLVLSISQDDSSLEEHLVAFSHTAMRRQSRNETVPGVDEELLRKLLHSQRAIVMQLHQGGQIVSSMYIILTPKSAFYFSGGTTPEGTRMGAFQYLIWGAIEELQSRGIASLTLGGTDAETPEGLRRFKLGFNAREVALAHTEYLLGIRPLTVATKLLQGLWRSPRSILSSIVSAFGQILSRLLKFTRWELYSTTSEVEPLDSDMEADLVIRKLTRSDYDQMSQLGGRFADQAKMFYFGRGIASAYGLFVKDELAHVSWVYTSEDYAREPAVQIELGPGEAEITNCYTLDTYRGQNLYAYAIARICNLLLSQDKSRIYMKVSQGNETSKKGIVKAGFCRDGTVLLLEMPVIRRWQGLSMKICSS